MYFLIDNKNLVIFGWSAKCGCTHVKTLFRYLRDDIINTKDIHKDSYNKLGSNILDSIENYKTIIFSRNPYERLVSGFLEKYGPCGEFRKLWPSTNIQFSNFVSKLGNYKVIEKHHFTPQKSEGFNNKIINSKSIKFFDIKNINYDYIEKIYNKKIPQELIEFKGPHTRDSKSLKSGWNKYVYNLNMKDYYNFKIETKYFYNDDLKQKVFEFYKDDFVLFNKFGLNYKL